MAQLLQSCVSLPIFIAKSLTWRLATKLSADEIIDLFRQLYFQSIQIIAYAIAGLEDLPGITFRLSVKCGCADRQK
ncbi:MAG: hypothetical protein WAK55_15475 [Xanthobacteraceae bacterium]